MTDPEKSPDQPQPPPPSRPMDIHDDLDKYFKTLHADPYGLENSNYDWSGEDRFVVVTGIAYLILTLGMIFASSEGWIPTLSLPAFKFFIAAAVFELLGKLFCSHLVLKYNIRINFVRKLGLRPWIRFSLIRRSSSHYNNSRPSSPNGMSSGDRYLSSDLHSYPGIAWKIALTACAMT